MKINIMSFIFVFLSVFSLMSMAGGSEKLKEVYKNKGFVIGNVKVELKNKFPVCDEFLNVEWLNKDKGLGYVKHDLYKNTKLVGQMDSLIFMRKNENQHYRPYDRIELYTFKKEGKYDALMEALKTGRITAFPETTGVNVFGENFRTHLSQNNLEMTYLENTAVVCIPYPDYLRVWLVENKAPEHFFNESDFEKYWTLLADKYAAYRNKSWRTKLFVLDLNSDGIYDFTQGNVYSLISNKESYQFMTKQSYRTSKIGSYWSIGFKGKEPLCEVLTRNQYFITADSKDFYQNNQCSFKAMLKGL